MAQSLLSQTWDVLDSPKFETVFSEACDSVFRKVLEALRRNVFSPESLSSNSSQRRMSPPLASVLPQVKAIAEHMLPGKLEPLPQEAKDIIAGTALDTLCVALFDSPEPGQAAKGRRDLDSWNF